MSARRTLVALLRGINVGGRNSVPMAGLRSVLKEMGLDDVTTYIQSGNVLFRSQAPVKSLPAQIEDAILSTTVAISVNVGGGRVDAYNAVHKFEPKPGKGKRP